jgi:arylsulfatase A-like enzyme
MNVKTWTRRFVPHFLMLLACQAGAYAADRPNVLLILSDDLAACLGCYGNEVCKTPNLDRLAAEGVVFDRAYCQYPLCGPSRASFMSGLYPNTTRMLGNSTALGSYRTTNPALADHPSIGGFLRRNRYVSLRVSKIFHMGIPGGIESGDAGGDDPDSWDRAFNVMAPETASPGKLELLSQKRTHFGSNFARVIVPDRTAITQTDHLAASQAIALLENRARGRRDSGFLRPRQPFFLAVGFIRPHVPLVAPKRIFAQYRAADMRLPHVPDGDLDDVPRPAAAMENGPRYGMDEHQQKQALAAYYASVSFMDEQVGRLLDALVRLKLRKNTIVIFAADHGYNLGEHNCWQKLSLFEESARVPLIISAPGYESSAGRHTSALTELVDLYPTIAELTGLADRAPKNLQGVSLCPILSDPERTTKRQFAYTITHQDGQSIRTDRWRYNRWGDSGEELYDHRSDPKEFANLAGDPRHEATLNEMRQLLRHAGRHSVPDGLQKGGASR